MSSSIRRSWRPIFGPGWLPTSSCMTAPICQTRRRIEAGTRQRSSGPRPKELFAELHWEAREFIDLGHAVVVETRIVALGRGSDVRIEADETDVFWFRDGALARLQGFPTKREALEATQRVA
jgi:hypothetical protein